MDPQLLTKEKVVINTSVSKQMYSFGKANRFGAWGRKEADTFYNLPSTLDKRATSLGKGTKSDFTAESRKKAQAIYNIPREFDLKRRNSPQYTFGLGRNECKNLVIMKRDNYPSPSTYNPYSNFGKEALKFSLFGRGWANKTASSPSRLPGPGQYSFPAINTKGRYPVTSLNNTQQNAFQKAMRFNYKYNNTPSPTEYNLTTFFNGTGRNYNSKYESNVAKTMASKTDFYASVRNTSPGPGSYDFFSDFEGFKRK